MVCRVTVRAAAAENSFIFSDQTGFKYSTSMERIQASEVFLTFTITI